MEETPLPLSGTMSGWIEFFIMAGAFLLVAGGSLIWLLYLRKPRRQRKHRHHRRRRSLPVTLAQTGGLPPVRPGEPASDAPPPNSRP
jgi:hypothetical protein